MTPTTEGVTPSEGVHTGGVQSSEKGLKIFRWGDDITQNMRKRQGVHRAPRSQGGRPGVAPGNLLWIFGRVSQGVVQCL